jgi:cellulase
MAEHDRRFYMSCYQLTVAGSGSASPATVKFPGAYSATDPGILINIHSTCMHSVSWFVSPNMSL